ncbi:MAG: alpha/beta hydrolase [Planctomycetota bacterium]
MRGFSLAWTLVVAAAAPAQDNVRHGMVDNDGVQLHYAAAGAGPLVVMLHGFPDFWWSWRHQMPALAEDHQVVALDLRGYNRSDKPPGVAAYRMPVLLSDVDAVIDHFDCERAILVGHDWGGAIAWQYAMWRPQRVAKLIVCNLPHPEGLMRELRDNPQQRENSAYAHEFQAEDAHERLTAEGLAAQVAGPKERPRYVEAFRRSDRRAMLAYYKANFPVAQPAESNPPPVRRDTADQGLPRVQCPVLLIHGLEDQALLASGLNDTWEWIDADLTIVTVPGAGHFVHHDAHDLVTRTMRAWLHR